MGGVLVWPADFHVHGFSQLLDGKLRLVTSSTNGAATVPVFDIATVDVDLEADERPGQFWLPISPLAPN